MDLKRPIILGLAIAVASTGCSVAGNPSTSAPPKPKPNLAGSLNWVSYTDSAEGAFSMDVPLGWQIQGGMYRFGYFDERWMMDVRSLDGKVIIRIDDPNVPPYVLPGPHSGPAGHAAIKPQMYQMIVDNYREAQPYAEGYAKHRFAGVCTSFTPRPSNWTPVLPRAWNLDPSTRVTTATISYDCATSDGPRIVTVYARSALNPASGLWQVDPLISILATPDKASLALTMTQHMISSWQVNPAWQAYQQQMTNAGLEQVRASFGKFLKQMQVFHQEREAAMNQQVAHFEAQQHAQAEQVTSWGETLTGLTTITDAGTGTRFQIFSGPKSNYYTNGDGVTINSNVSPGVGFHLAN